MKAIIKILKNIINSYEIKHPEYTKPIYICDSPDTRNRYKNDKYKISEDKPQCPVYKDNRCCGGCRFAATCEHCVDCGCYGFTYAQMGGNDKGHYLHKASEYYGLGRIGKDGKFDWDYYKLSLKRKEIELGKFIIIDKRVYKINSKVNLKNNFSAISCNSGKIRKFNIKELSDYITIYDSEEQAKMWI